MARDPVAFGYFEAGESFYFMDSDGDPITYDMYMKVDRELAIQALTGQMINVSENTRVIPAKPIDHDENE